MECKGQKYEMEILESLGSRQDHQIVTTASKKAQNLLQAILKQNKNQFAMHFPSLDFHISVLFLSQDLSFALTTSSDDKTCSNLARQAMSHSNSNCNHENSQKRRNKLLDNLLVRRVLGAVHCCRLQNLGLNNSLQ